MHAAKSMLDAWNTERRPHTKGYVRSAIFELDQNPDEFILAAVFDSKENYDANARAPEQDAWYQKLRAVLAEDPTWHDGAATIWWDACAMPVDHVRRIVAGKVEEIPPGERKIVVPFRGRAGIGVFNISGAYYALRNLCPHKLGPLCTGRVSGRVEASAPPSTYHHVLDVERDGEIIRCPWHLWEFDITTGACLVDSRMRVKTYPVVVEDEHVVVYADSADLPPVLLSASE
jgi:nitrite reductase/ring-hydroxylating ferredoxin subunit/quinol monooxygenase YgiN